ncbi:MAG: VWA domain-containing protein [Candidatus Obscuribacterales bacterium]|nr:VWA domain-containing protein [Candidatus Obscuribacterales bacterium]
MKSKGLPLALSLAASILINPLANAAGMIVIDPIQGGMPVLRPVTRPVTAGHSRSTSHRATPLLKGQVSFGLRLEAADIKVEINDQVAKTYITQTFFNDTDSNLAGTYLFPLPEDTTFSSFSLHIDGKPVEGKILEANEARQQYEEIVRRMVDPGLLEYADYKTVRARIFPIPAHGSKKVELEYTQVLKAENGLIKYNFPLKSEGESATADEIKINVKLASKQGLRTIWSPSHLISSKRDGDHKAVASYLGKDVVPDKDFLLYYSVSDKDMSANLLTHKDSGEDGYFLMTLTPPMKAKEVISKDIVFVADSSGSMTGKRMDENKRALKYLVNALNPSDRFSIVQFNTDVEAFKTSLLQASPENKKAAIAFVDEMEAVGGTNIGDALKTASSMLGGTKERPSYMVLMTDGEPTVGETSVAGLLKTIDAKKDIRIFDFGVGYDVNTKLLNKLADDNHGTAQYVEPEESLEVALSSFYDKIKSPVLSNVKLSFDGVQVKDMYPRNVKDIFAGTQVLLLGKYKGSGNGSCHMTGTINGVAKAYSFPLKFDEQELGHTYLPRLWAMRRIAHLTEVAQSNGENREIIDEIVALSKKYGIISNYTSYLVTDPSENQRIQPQRFDRALPVPQSSSAVRGSVSGAMLPTVNMGRHAVAPNVRQKAQAFNAPRAVQMLDDEVSVRDMREAAGGFGTVFAGGGGASGEGMKIAPPNTAPMPLSGKRAVKNAKELNEMKDSFALDAAKKESNAIKTVEDKTFYLRNGYWTDSAMDISKVEKPKEITFGSKEYFDLLRSVKGISKYLSVGRQVILVYQGHSYKISFNQGA